MEIAIIGAGYVGSVTGVGLSEIGHRVTLVDHDAAKSAELRQGRLPIYEPGLEELVARNAGAGRLHFSTEIPPALNQASIVFIAVGTPARQDGEADLTAIEAVCRDIGRCLTSYRVIVEKSTVPVNTCENIRRVINLNHHGGDYDLVSNPEFLREGCGLNDFFRPDRIVVGADSEQARQLMAELYRPLTSGDYYRAAGIRDTSPPPLLLTDIKSAELIKHASNAFLAMKISFINAISILTEQSGADIADVAHGIGLDARIGATFLQPGLGYGGSCFPKDLKAFYQIAEQLGYDFRLLREVEAINEDQKARFLRKIRGAIWNLRDKTVTVLGLAFKPDTDDIRQAPALEIIRELLREGASVRAYDPCTMKNAQRVLPQVVYCQDAYAALEESDCLVLCREWDEFRQLDLARVRKLMRYPIVVAGRNAFDPATIRGHGFHYSSIGRSALSSESGSE